MYDAILHKPLPLRPGKSDAVCSLLTGLLQKDQNRRLGAIADFVSVGRGGGLGPRLPERGVSCSTMDHHSRALQL